MLLINSQVFSTETKQPFLFTDINSIKYAL